MRHPSPYVLNVASLAATLGTAAAAALGVPQAVWIGMVVLTVALIAWALILHVREGRPASVQDPQGELKAQLAAVDGVRTWLNLLEDSDEPLPLDEDQVFQWAKKTYKLIQKKFPTEADTFMGEEDAQLGSPYFATVYVLRRDELGRRGYLQSRSEMVRRMLREGIE